MMFMKDLRDVCVNDSVTMKKKHPCGSYVWVVKRVGADIGLQCQVCNRKILITRAQFNKRAKKITNSP